ncbi:hypothetical protein Anas_07828 [Armadillidium nasatum]|uniref:OTU domain-containing protein n=1 Tax=Armadillidium nasatum TaxID=96803 RepID=A0A5N5TIQ4_9CRUS|nr:hypothetical protein Anas_07828 [Armadillidium nasatum]
MMRKRTISIGNNCIEPIDNWLENNHLHRKQVPRDASCLFRAIAELRSGLFVNQCLNLDLMRSS